MELAGAPCSPSAQGWDGKRRKFEWKAAVVDGFAVSILLDERSYFPRLGFAVSEMTICSARRKDVRGAEPTR